MTSIVAVIIALPSIPPPSSAMSRWREVNEELERMERIVGAMADEEEEGSANGGVAEEDRDGQQDESGRQGVEGRGHYDHRQDQDREESETAAAEHAEVEAQVHRGEIQIQVSQAS